MRLVAAVSVALAVFLAMAPSASRRARKVFGDRQSGRGAGGVRLDRGSAAAMAVICVATFFVGWPWGTAGALALFPLIRARVNLAGQRTDSAVAAEIPLAFDLVAAALEAGRAPGPALAAAGRAVGGWMGEELLAMAESLITATDPSQAWDEATTRHSALAPLGRAILRAERSGAAPAAVVTQVAAEVRLRRQGERIRQTRRGGVATAAPLGLCFLPAFFLVGVVPTLIGLVGSTLR